MFRSSTPIVIRNTPAHASSCQFVKGLIANLKMVTGRLAIGSFRLSDQNWLDNAVKSSGAVSPAIRATASNTPVSTPARAARRVTLEITTLFGAPRAKAASRSVLGMSCNMFSVVRTTTGRTISASASTPDQAENLPVCATTTAYTKRPITIDGADSSRSLMKRVTAPNR